MYLLTPHGTLIGIDVEGKLIQLRPLVDNLPNFLRIEDHKDGDIITKGPFAGCQVEFHPNGLSVRKDNKYLCAPKDSVAVVINRDKRLLWETFASIPDDKITGLLTKNGESNPHVQALLRLFVERKPFSSIPDSRLTFVDPQAIRDQQSAKVHADLSFVVRINRSSKTDIHYFVPACAGLTHHKTVDAVNYIASILTAYPAVSLNPPPSRSDYCDILFQAADTPVNVLSVSWESQRGWTNIRLVPDLYYFRAQGYEGFLPPGSADCPAWSERKAVLFWRGQTTGMSNLTIDSLKQVPRYRLCVAARNLGNRCDVGLSGVVQTATRKDHSEIVSSLTAEGLMRSFVEFKKFAAYKFVMDIDGNTNAWNFIRKLRLGSCILKTASRWRQWFSDRLIPWEHYVPVSEDLEDFCNKVEWCFSHDSVAAEIAANGRNLALSLSFQEEMRNAAMQFFLASSA